MGNLKQVVQSQKTMQEFSNGDSSARMDAFSMLQQQTNVSRDDISKLTTLISKILETLDIQYDDQGDKIEMLRRIEMQLNHLCEARDDIASKKKKELDDKEAKLHAERRQQRIEKKKMEEELKKDERQRKNRARIKKQEEFKIFKGRKQVFRSNKVEVKPKEDNEQKLDEETLDRNRYLGVF